MASFLSGIASAATAGLVGHEQGRQDSLRAMLVAKAQQAALLRQEKMDALAAEDRERKMEQQKLDNLAAGHTPASIETEAAPAVEGLADLAPLITASALARTGETARPESSLTAPINLRPKVEQQGQLGSIPKVTYTPAGFTDPTLTRQAAAQAAAAAEHERARIEQEKRDERQDKRAEERDLRRDKVNSARDERRFAAQAGVAAARAAKGANRRPIPSSAVEKLSGIDNMISMAQEVSKALSGAITNDVDVTGRAGGVVSTPTWVKNATGKGGDVGKDVRAVMGNLYGTVAKERGGTALSASELRLLESYLPNENEPETTALIKVNRFARELQRMRDNKVKLYAEMGYGGGIVDDEAPMSDQLERDAVGTPPAKVPTYAEWLAKQKKKP